MDFTDYAPCFDDLKLEQLHGITLESSNDYEGEILSYDDN